jgi:hypothetical protein
MDKAVKLTQFEINDSKVSINVEYIKRFISSIKIPNSVKVITTLGVARSGKSAFLNCLITAMKLYKTNFKPFHSLSAKASEGKDVTIGVNGYLCEDTKDNYLFLDIQGIAGQNSETDPATLLYCYYISDLIILNIDKQLNTQALNLLTPIAAKLQEMTNASKLHKPSLLFRIYDCLDNYDDLLAKQNYSIMMEDRNDAVQGIRKAINELFTLPENKIVWTERPDKSEIKLLDEGNIVKFHASDNNFKEAVNKIIDVIRKLPYRPDFGSDKLLSFANDINEQISKLKSSEFDIATTINHQEMIWWIEGDKYNTKDDRRKSEIPEELKTVLSIPNCTEATWQIILIRRSKIDALIKNFNERFSKSPSNLRVGGEKLLQEIIMPPLKVAKDKFNEFADAAIAVVNSTIKSYDCNDSTDIKSSNEFMKTTVENAYKVTHIAEHVILSNLQNMIERSKNLTKQMLEYNNNYHKNQNINVLAYTNNLNQIAKDIRQELMNFVDALELDYSDIQRSIIKSVREKNKITFRDLNTGTSSLVDKIKSYLFTDESDYVAVKLKRLKLDIIELKVNVVEEFNTNLPIIVIKNKIESAEGILYRTIIDNINWFYDQRAKRLSELLQEINKLSSNERHVKFNAIKHNNLLMINWLPGGHIGSTGKTYPEHFINPNLPDRVLSNGLLPHYYLPAFLEKDSNTFIYTHDSFRKTFGNRIYAMYCDIHNEKISSNMREVLKMEIIREVLMLPYQM